MIDCIFYRLSEQAAWCTFTPLAYALQNVTKTKLKVFLVEDWPEHILLVLQQFTRN